MLADPAVESVGGFIGGGRGINNAQTFVRLKPLAGAQGLGRSSVADRLRRNLPHVPGARIFLFADQDIRFGGGSGSGSALRYTLLADDTRLLRVWGERVTHGARQSCRSSPASTTSWSRASRSR